MWALKLLIALVALYASVALIGYLAQTSLLFPASLAGQAHVPLPGAEPIACDTPDGERLRGVRIAPREPSNGDPIIVLGFGGNAWNAENMAAQLHELFPAAEIVTFHYRGYRPSTGRPSAAALLADAPLVYDCAARVRDDSKVVVVGFSIGTGVAVHLARARPVAGMILVTPFDTLEALAREHYGWLPVGLLLRHHMFPAEEIRSVVAPVALIAAENDAIIPERRSAPLRKSTPDLIMDQILVGVGHNDIYQDSAFAPAMHRAMRLIEDRSK